MNEAFAKFILTENEFRHADAAQILALLECSDRQSFAENSFIYTPEHDLRYIYIVEKGAVELFSYSPNRVQKRTFAIVNRGIIFGFGELCGRKHSLYAQTVVKSVIIRIPLQHFLDTVTSHRALTLDFFFSYSYQICQSQRADLLESAEMKIITYLSWIARDHGKNEGSGISVRRNQTYEEIGNLLFLTRETVIRTLQGLEADGIITIERKKIVLHKPEFLAEKSSLHKKHFSLADEA